LTFSPAHAGGVSRLLRSGDIEVRREENGELDLVRVGWFGEIELDDVALLGVVDEAQDEAVGAWGSDTACFGARGYTVF
jgi:hypothetical protein